MRNIDLRGKRLEEEDWDTWEDVQISEDLKELIDKTDYPFDLEDLKKMIFYQYKLTNLLGKLERKQALSSSATITLNLLSQFSKGLPEVIGMLDLMKVNVRRPCIKGINKEKLKSVLNKDKSMYG